MEEASVGEHLNNLLLCQGEHVMNPFFTSEIETSLKKISYFLQQTLLVKNVV